MTTAQLVSVHHFPCLFQLFSLLFLQLTKTQFMHPQEIRALIKFHISSRRLQMVRIHHPSPILWTHFNSKAFEKVVRLMCMTHFTFFSVLQLFIGYFQWPFFQQVSLNDFPFPCSDEVGIAATKRVKKRYVELKCFSTPNLSHNSWRLGYS